MGGGEVAFCVVRCRRSLPTLNTPYPWPPQATYHLRSTPHHTLRLHPATVPAAVDWSSRALAALSAHDGPVKPALAGRGAIDVLLALADVALAMAEHAGILAVDAQAAGASGRRQHPSFIGGGHFGLGAPALTPAQVSTVHLALRVIVRCALSLVRLSSDAEAASLICREGPAAVAVLESLLDGLDAIAAAAIPGAFQLLDASAPVGGRPPPPSGTTAPEAVGSAAPPQPTVRDLLTRGALAIATAATQLGACPEPVNFLGTQGLARVAVRLGTLAQGRVSCCIEGWGSGSSGSDTASSTVRQAHALHHGRRLSSVQMQRYGIIGDLFMRGGPLSDFVPVTATAGDAPPPSLLHQPQQPGVRATLALAAVLSVYNVTSNPNGEATAYLQAMTVARRAAEANAAAKGRTSLSATDAASTLGSPGAVGGGGGDPTAPPLPTGDMTPARLLGHLVAAVHSVANLLPAMHGRQLQPQTSRGGTPLSDAAFAAAHLVLATHQQSVAALVSIAAALTSPVDDTAIAMSAATATASALNTPSFLLPLVSVTESPAGTSTASDEGFAVLLANLAAAAPSRFLPPRVIEALVQVLHRSQETSLGGGAGSGSPEHTGSGAPHKLMSLKSRLHLSSLLQATNAQAGGRGSMRGVPFGAVHAEAHRLVAVQVGTWCTHSAGAHPRHPPCTPLLSQHATAMTGMRAAALLLSAPQVGCLRPATAFCSSSNPVLPPARLLTLFSPSQTLESTQRPVASTAASHDAASVVSSRRSSLDPAAATTAAGAGATRQDSAGRPAVKRLSLPGSPEFAAVAAAATAAAAAGRLGTASAASAASAAASSEQSRAILKDAVGFDAAAELAAEASAAAAATGLGGPEHQASAASLFTLKSLIDRQAQEEARRARQTESPHLRPFINAGGIEAVAAVAMGARALQVWGGREGGRGVGRAAAAPLAPFCPPLAEAPRRPRPRPEHRRGRQQRLGSSRLAARGAAAEGRVGVRSRPARPRPPAPVSASLPARAPKPHGPARARLLLRARLADHRPVARRAGLPRRGAAGRAEASLCSGGGTGTTAVTAGARLGGDGPLARARRAPADAPWSSRAPVACAEWQPVCAGALGQLGGRCASVFACT